MEFLLLVLTLWQRAGSREDVESHSSHTDVASGRGSRFGAEALGGYRAGENVVRDRDEGLS